LAPLLEIFQLGCKASHNVSSGIDRTIIDIRAPIPYSAHHCTLKKASGASRANRAGLSGNTPMVIQFVSLDSASEEMCRGAGAPLPGREHRLITAQDSSARAGICVRSVNPLRGVHDFRARLTLNGCRHGASAMFSSRRDRMKIGGRSYASDQRLPALSPYPVKKRQQRHSVPAEQAGHIFAPKRVTTEETSRLFCPLPEPLNTVPYQEQQACRKNNAIE
jgi:hypothetical protein